MRRNAFLFERRADLREFATKQEFVSYAYGAFERIDKNTLITSFCEGRDVLDLGCIDHGWRIALGLGADWLHHQIKEVATSAVGLDILAEDAVYLNQRGYNIVAGNAESFDLGRSFDVIVVGDLIEHLSNIGQLLDCMARHMHDSSVAIVTTPNPFNIEQTMLGLFENKILVNNEHTVWIDPRVMYELIGRSHLRIVDFYWVETRFQLRTQRRLWRHLANRVSEALMKFRPLFRRDFAVILAKG